MTIENRISEQYLEQITELHASDETWGTSGNFWFPAVKNLVQQLSPKTILDYGCGKGVLLKELRKEFEPYLDSIEGYDPGVPEFMAEPEPADLVICTDVMEHIEPEKLDGVLDHIASLTNDFAFVVISLRKARAILPDGRNAHLIVADEQFWFNRFAEKFASVEMMKNHPRGEAVIEARK